MKRICMTLALACLLIFVCAGGAYAAKPACSDGKDNDGDGKIDLADPGCTSRQDKDETNTVSPPPPPPPPPSGSEAARQADAFVDSIGVNSHLGWYDTNYSNLAQVQTKLGSLGVRHARDLGAYRPGNGADADLYGRYKQVNTNTGVKFDLLLDPRYSSTGNTVEPTEASYVINQAGPALASLEGPNEWDVSGISGWASTLKGFQQSLYTSTAGAVPVLCPPLAFSTNASQVGNIEAYCDYGNMHPYPGGKMPTNGLQANIDNYRASMIPSKPFRPTETGYHNATKTSSGHLPASEAAAGKYMPRLFLEYFNKGFSLTYSYEFLDAFPESALTNPEDHFGLLRNDFSEKPAYTSMKNLIGLLKDQGPSFSPGSLSYSLSGDTTNVHKTLLQKRDGRFYLILWQEVSSYDTTTRTDTQVAPVNVGVSFDTARTVTTYTPVTSASSQGSQSGQQQTVSIGDTPTVLEIS